MTLLLGVVNRVLFLFFNKFAKRRLPGLTVFASVGIRYGSYACPVGKTLKEEINAST